MTSTPTLSAATAAVLWAWNHSAQRQLMPGAFQAQDSPSRFSR
jgi:hypothetical protein